MGLETGEDSRTSRSASVLETPPALTNRVEALARWLLQPGIFLRIGMVILAALYVRTVTYDFVYDDLTGLVSEAQSWKSIPSVFTHDLFAVTGGGSGSVYYRPLAPVVGIVLGLLTGGAPAWFHLYAIFLHLAVFGLAYLLGRLLFRDETVALVAALLYALHPTKVESVAWAGGGACDGLGAIFFFGTLICYLKWREVRRRGWLAGSVALFAGAMLTKETLIILPALIAAHYWLNALDGRGFRETIRLMIPFGIVLAGYMYLRHIALSAPPTAVSSSTAEYIRPTFTWTNVWSAPVACWWYIKHLACPTGLSVVYDSIIVYRPTLRGFVLPALALVAFLGVAGWIWLRHRSANSSFLIIWSVIAMAPYIVLAPMVQQHDRYLHIASYAFCAGLGYVIVRAGNLDTRKTWIRFAAGVALMALWAGSVWHETGFWEDNLSLWKRAAKIAPSLIEPRHILANLYAEKGDPAAAFQAIDDGLKLRPNSPTLWQTRALLLYRNQRYEEARQSFLKSMDAGESYVGRPICAYYLGQIDIRDKNFVSAERWLRMAIASSPQAVGYHSSLAIALEGQGRIAEAKEQYQMERELVGRYAAAREKAAKANL